MVFNYKNKIIKIEVSYCFPDKSSGGIFRIAAYVEGTRQQILEQLTERYGNPVTQTEFAAEFVPQDKPYTISLKGLNLTYTPK